MTPSPTARRAFRPNNVLGCSRLSSPPKRWVSGSLALPVPQRLGTGVCPICYLLFAICHYREAVRLALPVPKRPGTGVCPICYLLFAICHYREAVRLALPVP